MSKRMMIAVSVPDDADKHNVALCVDAALDAALGSRTDATAWEWADFWADVADEVVNIVRDSTAAGVSA